MGQVATSGNYRIRTSTDTFEDWTVANVFTSLQAVTHVVMTWDGQDMGLFVDNGRINLTNTHVGDLSNWINAYHLLLANEASLNRDWVGTMFQVAIYDRVLTYEEMIQNYAEGHTMRREPVAVINASKLQGKAPLDVTFSASDSNDSYGEVTAYEWNVSGTGYSTEEVSHQFPQAGSFNVSLTVTDDDGYINTTSVLVEVVNREPMINITATPNAGIVPLQVHFNGSDSSDLDGSISTYDWNISGTLSSESTVDHLFTQEGLFNVSLTITDNGGLTNSSSVWVDVQNRAPMIDGGENVSLQVNTTHQFTALGNDTANDLPLLEYQWNMSDGTVSNWSANSGFEHQFSELGNYTVTVTVRDDDAAEASDELVVSVFRLEENNGENESGGNDTGSPGDTIRS